MIQASERLRSNDLFDLIKSMSRSEKRYFRLYTARHGGTGNKLSARLFQLLERQKQYDIEEVFRKEKAIRPEQARNIKKYLYSLILKILSSYHAGKGAGGQIRNLLNHVAVLYEKGLYSQCSVLLARARKFAISFEKHIELLEILRWEKRLLTAIPAWAISIEKIHSLESNALDRLKNISDLSEAGMRMYELVITTGRSRKKEDLIRMDRLLKNPAVHCGKKNLSYEARGLLYNFYGLYYRSRSDLGKAYYYRKNLVSLMETYPQVIAEEPRKYIIALNNLLVCQLELREYTSFAKTLARLRALAVPSISLRTEILTTTIPLEIRMYINNGEFRKGLELIPAMEESYGQYEKQMPYYYKSLISCSFATLYFCNNDLAHALVWINRVVQQPAHRYGEDIFCFAKILELIIHMELKHLDLLEYSVRSTYRLLLKKERLYRFEGAILDFIRKDIARINPLVPKEARIAFSRLRNTLRSVVRDPYERKALEYFDFTSWLESKISGRPFPEIVKEKALADKLS